ncbi:MAG: Gfo/Idh/MocA family oxidoreductase [Bacteroidales bacterium]|nr:Gfo/Idh/MocA family oxidoreductase [Bacteroidales bacterium]
MKISVVGTGKIVGEVLEMLHRELPGKVEVTGIFAREQSVEHAIDLCQQYAPTGFVYTDYDRMLAEAEADFVYVANANHVHYEYAARAIRTQHNVIVEKPIASNRSETELLLDLAIQWGVYCMPAYSLLYMPLFFRLNEYLPRLGTIRMVNCCYAQYSSRYDKYLRGEVTPTFDPACSGGALMDLNVYNLCFLIGLFGPPRTAYFMKNTGHNGIDTSGTMLLHYPTFVASLSAAKDSDGHSFGCIQGELGYIEVKGSVSVLQEFTVHLRGEEPVTFRATEGSHRLGYEFQAFCDLIENPMQCHLNVPYLNSVALEVAIAMERMQILL